MDYRRGNKNQSALAVTHNISRTTVQSILKNADKIVQEYDNGKNCEYKRLKSYKFEEIEKPLLDYFRIARKNNQPISGELLLQKARRFVTELDLGDPSELNPSWINRWKNRNEIVCKRLHGEAGSVDASVVDSWLRSRLPLLLQEFSPEDIFNCDEAGLFYKCLPDRTHVFKGEKCSGGKMSKERVTVLVAASMAGEKLPLIVIGRFAKPRCLKYVKRTPIEYFHNRRAWMTADIFTTFCQKLDRKMQLANRKIALVLDNCSAHDRLQTFENVRLVFLPANTTAKTQPMDAGVIHSLKANYRKELALAQLHAYDNKTHFHVDVLKCMKWLLKAWENVSRSTIVNCFNHVGFRLENVPTQVETITCDQFQENIWDVVV